MIPTEWEPLLLRILADLLGGKETPSVRREIANSGKAIVGCARDAIESSRFLSFYVGQILALRLTKANREFLELSS